MLNLAENRFVPYGAEVLPRLAGAFAGLKVLVLSDTQLPWSAVQLLEPCLPVLEELHLCRNGYSVIDADAVTGFTQLTLLNLSENAISEWAEVAKFGSLPRLQRLFVSDNRLTSLALPAGASGASAGGAGSLTATSSLFPCLDTLSMSNNAVARWSDLEALTALPTVTSLRFQANPLIAVYSPGQARQLLVARLAQVKVLNSSEVRPREREDSEKAYLARCRSEFLAAQPEGSVSPTATDAELFGTCSLACEREGCERGVCRAQSV